jgi:hypothetical protein
MRRYTLTTSDGEVYLDRLRIVQTPWFGVYLHRLDVPDPGVDLHDHPWTFASVILRGGYDEEVCDTDDAEDCARWAERWPGTCTRGFTRSWTARSVHRLLLTECHRITRLHRSPTWTLIITGPRRRSWGFYQPEGFVDHRDYDYVVRRELRVQS